MILGNLFLVSDCLSIWLLDSNLWKLLFTKEIGPFSTYCLKDHNDTLTAVQLLPDVTQTEPEVSFSTAEGD